MMDKIIYDPEQAAEGERVPGRPNATMKAKSTLAPESTTPAEISTPPTGDEVTVLPIDPVALQKARADEDAGDEGFPMVEPDTANDASSDPDYL